MLREEGNSEDMITIDRWDASGIHDNGGQYGDQTSDDQEQEPPIG